MPAGQVNGDHVTISTCSTPTCGNESPVVSTKTDPETVWDGYLSNWGLFRNFLTSSFFASHSVAFRGAPLVSGGPLGIRHYASRSKRSFEPSSRALFEDAVPLRAGVNGLDTLLPADENVEKNAQVDKARKMANVCNDKLPRRRLIKREIEDEGEGEEVAMNVDKVESLRIDSQDLLSSDY